MAYYMQVTNQYHDASYLGFEFIRNGIFFLFSLFKYSKCYKIDELNVVASFKSFKAV